MRNPARSSPQIPIKEPCREQGKAEMNEFGENVVTEIKGNEVEQVQIHRIVGKRHERNFMHPSVLEVQFRDSQVMNEFVFSHGRHP